MSISSNPRAFAGERKSQQDGGLSTLLNANNLGSYVLPSALSVTVARSHKKSYATSNEFKTVGGINTVSFILKPGSDYVYGPDSFLSFQLSVAAPAGSGSYSFGRYGSALNLFKSVRLTHASGTEVEFTSNANLLNTFKMNYERSSHWRRTIGSQMGAWFRDDDGKFKTNVTANLASTLVTDIVIPLSMLSDMFNSDKLIPPYMLAGLRIELELESAYVAFYSTAATTTDNLSYSLTENEMFLDSHTLTDSVQKAISRMSAEEGLDLHFASWFHDRHTMTSTTSTVNITKALSRVEDIQLIQRTPADYSVATATMNLRSLVSSDYVTSAWQVSIGSMFFPSHSVIKEEQAYQYAMQGRDVAADVSQDDFGTEIGIIRANLERSQILNGSGIAISATRGATVQVSTTVDDTLDVFVKHTRLVSVFLDNVVVRT